MCWADDEFVILRFILESFFIPDDSSLLLAMAI